MSYSIFIVSKDNSKKDIPFSTNKNYDQIILPIAEKLLLPMIMEIQYGITINHESELVEFINEIKDIKKSKLITSSDRYNSDRIDFLISELEDIQQKNEYKSIDIG
ncbi:hypothetical protein ETU09_08020 [Apibacter muscae]|uniref:Uncharacterized protein n=1 Tax=Apibacter muscae TaxID=2509004 RepID=A0A563DA16_9FLAO|nr:hypothetical protein [Apibacter muscae]TWP27056.1 hypothetical protein ETU09_08020 [Apibacter muscae]